MNQSDFVCAALCLLSCACTHVEIAGEAEVTRESALKVSVSPGPSGRLLVSRLTGVGVIPQDSGITFGFLRETRVMVGDPRQCRIVVLAERDEQMRDIQALLSGQGHSLANLCVGSLGGKP